MRLPLKFSYFLFWNEKVFLFPSLLDIFSLQFLYYLPPLFLSLRFEDCLSFRIFFVDGSCCRIFELELSSRMRNGHPLSLDEINQFQSCFKLNFHVFLASSWHSLKFSDCLFQILQKDGKAFIQTFTDSIHLSIMLALQIGPCFLILTKKIYGNLIKAGQQLLKFKEFLLTNFILVLRDSILKLICKMAEILIFLAQLFLKICFQLPTLYFLSSSMKHIIGLFFLLSFSNTHLFDLSLFIFLIYLLIFSIDAHSLPSINFQQLQLLLIPLESLIIFFLILKTIFLTGLTLQSLLGAIQQSLNNDA